MIASSLSANPNSISSYQDCQTSKKWSVGISLKSHQSNSPQSSTINRQLYSYSTLPSYSRLYLISYYLKMFSFPSKSRQSPQNGQFQSLSSRPVSPLPSPSLISHGPSNSAASSAYLLDRDYADSTTTLPRYPQPTFFRNHSTTSLTSEYDDYDGSTACPTPNPERVLSSGDDSDSEKSKSVCSFKKSIDPASYTIETLHQHDDADLLTPWKRRFYRLSPLFTFLAVSAYFLYYGYRIHCTVYAQRAYHKTYVMAWLFIAAEGCVACWSLPPLHIFVV